MKYKIEIEETYVYNTEINANNVEDAIKQAKLYHNKITFEFVGLDNSMRHQKTSFKIVNE